MRSKSRWLPVLAGAVAGGLIAWAVAGGSSTKSSTTTVIQSGGGTGVPTSLSTTQGRSVNQIYRQAGSGVVDITVTSVHFDMGG